MRYIKEPYKIDIHQAEVLHITYQLKDSLGMEWKNHKSIYCFILHIL